MTELNPSYQDAAHATPRDDVIRQLASLETGLSKAEAALRINQFGPNSLPVSKPQPAWANTCSTAKLELAFMA